MRLSNRWSKKTLKNAGTKLFSLPYVFVHCKYRVTLKKIWQNKKINIFFGNVLVALKKTQDFFTILCRLYVYFSDFFHVWKIAGQISWPFQEFKMLYEPYNIKFLQGNKKICAIHLKIHIQSYIQSVWHWLKINWCCWNPLSISHKAVCQAENIRKKSQKLLNYYYWVKNLELKFLLQNDKSGSILCFFQFL